MYTDLLTKIKNAQAAGRSTMKTGYSRMEMDILDILVATGFLKSAAKKGRMPKRVIDLELKYDAETGAGAIHGLRFVSKPSRKIYAGYRSLKSVKQGYGLAVISTPEGVMTTDNAKKRKLGGQLLFEIW